MAGATGPTGVGVAGATGPTGPIATLLLNYTFQLGAAQTTEYPCVGDATWVAVPSLGPVTLTTSGRPLIIQGQVRQYKGVTCTQRGHVTVALDGNLILDPSGLGMASTYECNAVATLNAMLQPPAGTHTFQLYEYGEGGCMVTYGTTDFIYVEELPN